MADEASSAAQNGGTPQQNGEAQNAPVSPGGAPKVHDPDADRAKFLHETVVSRSSTLLDSSQTKFDIFLEWLLKHGARFPDLYFKVYAPNVRGVHAARRLPALYRFMEIPLRCLITDDLARRTPVGQKLKIVEKQLSVPNHCQIIVFMLLTRAQGNSFFQPYYDVLPSDFDNFPIFWAPNELAWLKGSSLVKQIEERKHNMRSDYDHICKHIEEFRRFSFEEFLWCRTAVGSRNFSITIRGQKRTAMVPQADMLNHFRPRECSWTYDNAIKSFTMTTLKPITEQAQVFDSYGKKCNSKFLLHYGFTIESNREADGICQNELQLVLTLATNDPLFTAKRAFVNPRMQYALSMNSRDDGTIDCLNYLRIREAKQEELERVSRKFKQRGPIGLANERRVFAALAEVARRQLERYPTTLEEDDEQLRDGGLDPFSNHRHAVIVIRGEKEICHFFIRLNDVVQELLSPETSDREADIMAGSDPKALRAARVEAHFSGKSDIDRFVHDIHRQLAIKGL